MDKRAVMAACQRYRLTVGPKSAGRPAGKFGGEGTGASVEFAEFRPYVLGDDPRHIDWAAYARSGHLTLRMFREEVSPYLDILLDGSRSMGLADGRKAALAAELAFFFRESGRLEGLGTHCFLATDRLTRLQADQPITFQAKNTLLFEKPRACKTVLRPRSMRIVISDFLTLKEPQTALQQLATGGASLLTIMLLGPWEANPPIGGYLNLQDTENHQELPLLLSTRQCKKYLHRLSGIQEGLRGVCRKNGGVFAKIQADLPLSGVLRRDLLPLGVLQPVKKT